MAFPYDGMRLAFNQFFWMLNPSSIFYILDCLSIYGIVYMGFHFLRGFTIHGPPRFLHPKSPKSTPLFDIVGFFIWGQNCFIVSSALLYCFIYFMSVYFTTSLPPHDQPAFFCYCYTFRKISFRTSFLVNL
jgi:RsiW-degrading membrane proteinase PrsW (M82 family)